MEVKQTVFAKAAIALVVLFALSIYAGYAIESENYSKTEGRINEFQNELENAMLFSLFIQTYDHSDSMCTVFKDQIAESTLQTRDVYIALEASRGGVFTQYETLRREYFLANMRFYLLASQYKRECNDSDLEPILFFYTSNSDCPVCAAQGKVLDSVVAECPNIRVYALPADVEQVSMIKAFKAYYGVNVTPSIVIKDVTYSKPMAKDEIEQKIGCIVK